MIVTVFRSGLRRLFWAPVILTLFLGFFDPLRPANAEGELHIYNARYYTSPAVIARIQCHIREVPQAADRRV